MRSDGAQERSTMKTFALLFFLLTAGSFVTAQTPASAAGTLTVNGKTFTLSHVRALEWPDPFDDTKKIIRVVLSDAAVSDNALASSDTLEDLILAEKVHAIEFTFTSEGETFGGELYYDMMSHGFTHGSFNFEKKVFDSKTVSGKVSTQPVSKSAEMQFKCAVTFTAAIER